VSLAGTRALRMASGARQSVTKASEANGSESISGLRAADFLAASNLNMASPPRIKAQGAAAAQTGYWLWGVTLR
jgi:Tfp pilus assembly protein PilW